MRSSNASAPCRFELRPSRWLTAMMLLLAALAPCSVLISEMPRIVAWPVALVAALLGLALAGREWRRPRQTVVIGPDAHVEVDGLPVDAFELAWRGPVAFLSWRGRDGRPARRSLWPDALDDRLRRELRLVMQARAAVRGGGPVAP